jgi:hypothetical protein
MSYIQLEDDENFGCRLRDAIYNAINNKIVTYSQLNKKMHEIEIPEEYWVDIIKMCEYRKLDRETDLIEQRLERIVHKGIIKKITNTLNQNNNANK